MRHGVNHPAYTGSLHPGANLRQRLTTEKQPVVAASEGSEGMVGCTHLKT